MSFSTITVSWQITPVDLEVGYSTWPSLAFSPTGQPAIAYYSSVEHALRFATLNTGGTWDISVVDLDVFGDCYPRLRFRANQPGISYSVPAPPLGLRYARQVTPAVWDIQNLLGGWGGNSLAFDPALQSPGISYYGFENDKGLGYYQSQGAGWVGSVVDPGQGVAYFNSLAFTPAGQPAIAYTDDANRMIKYAVFDGVSGNPQTVASGDGWCSLIFTPAGDPAIAYVQGQDFPRSVMLALPARVGWSIQTVVGSADSPWLAVTPSGQLAISYYSVPPAAIKYAVLLDGGWTHFEVERAGKDSTGNLIGPFTFTSLAFNPVTGQPAIVYYDRASAAIRYAVGTVSPTLLGWVLSILRQLFGAQP